MLKNTLSYFIIITFFIITTFATNGADVTVSEFNNAYKEYVSNVNNNADETQLAEDALVLFEMSTSLSGKQHPNTIALLNSAANHYRNAGMLEDAIKYYDETLSLIDNSELESTVTHVNLLAEILDTKGATSSRDRDEISEELFREVRDLFQQTDPDETLLVSLNAFSTMIENKDLGVKFSRLNRFANKLIAKAEELLPETSFELIRAQFNQGILLQSMKEEKEAINAFVKVVDVVSNNTDYSHPYEVAAHARLVNLFEKKGDSQAATEHCLAIGKMTPWQEDIKPQPLFRLPPKYPTKMARNRKEGWVLLSFDISAYGFVENIAVLESSHRGFEEVSKEALERWRYAPKFEDGQAVKAEDMRVQLDYTFGNRDRNFKNI